MVLIQVENIVINLASISYLQLPAEGSAKTDVAVHFVCGRVVRLKSKSGAAFLKMIQELGRLGVTCHAAA